MTNSQLKSGAAKSPRVIRKFDPAWRLQQVAASYAPGASVTAVARRAGVRPNLLSFWRQRYGAKFRGRGTAAPKFVPVTVAPALAPGSSSSWIEIDIATGAIRLRGEVSAAQLREVLSAVR
jgi:transposase